MTLTAPGPATTGTESGGTSAAAPPGGRPGAETQEPVRRRRLAAHPAWIVVAAMAAVLVRTTMHTGISNDAWWHWAAGKWMLTHHAVIRRDVFSYTIPGHPWVAEEWGFEVALAWLVRTLGGTAFWLVAAGPCVGALLLGVARWRRLGAGMLRTAGLSVVAGGYLLFGEAPRPQVASYLLFSVLLLVLTVARTRPRWLALLPLLFLVWANVHGSFLAGLGVLALDLVLSAVPFRRGRLAVVTPLPLRPGGAALGASFLATLCNPHGAGLLTYAWKVTSAPQLTAWITEWQSPNFHTLPLLLLVVVPAGITLAALALGDVELNVFDLVLWGGFLVATLHSQRFLPYAGLAWCGLAARARPRVEGVRPSRATWPLVGAALAVVLVGPHVPAGAPARGGTGGEPVAAVQWLSSHPGRVFSEYTWDDYLIGQGRPVFVDGRTDLYFGTGVLGQYIDVAGLTTDPDPVLARWGVRYVLWPEKTPLAVHLGHDPHWRVAFRSGASVVFTRA